MSAEFIMRGLLAAAAASDDSHGDTSGGHDDHGETCYCLPYHPHGAKYEKIMMMILQWFMFAFSIGCLVFYGYHSFKATCGWEEVYVCIIELIKVVLEIFAEIYSPCTVTQINGVVTPWLRYGEWLLTCPVILIHLSNLTGLKNNYSKRTMMLLMSDLGTIVMGITAALSASPVKIIFFCIGVCYGCNTWFHAAKVYVEAYHSVPKGECRTIVKIMAWLFFASWTAFPILFVMGPEGFGHLTMYGGIIAHTVVDFMSKNLWGLFGHHLRIKIHEHILIHGDIRKKTTINVAGEDMEIEEFVEEEDNDEGAVRHPTSAYNKRGSFLVMRDQLKAKGVDVRASLDGEHDDPNSAMSAGMMMGPGMGFATAVITANKGGMGGKGANIEPGRVILGVVDTSMADFFREQFTALPVNVELVPALGADAVLQTVSNAAGFGGADLVLLHPEYLRERGPGGLVARLKAAGQRVCAFGWAQAGPMRELVESAGLDGWLEGPSWGSGINLQQLVQLIAQMQQQRKSAGMYANGGMTRSYSNLSTGVQVPNPLASLTRPGSPGPNMGANMGAPNFGNAMNSGLYSSTGAQGATDADMLQQLMSEINRLKNELGEGR